MYTNRTRTTINLESHATTAICAQMEQKETVTATTEECEALIACLKDPTASIYSVKCPNGKAVSHSSGYDCQDINGVKYKLDGDTPCFTGESEEECPVDQFFNEVKIMCGGHRFLFAALAFKFWKGLVPPRLFTRRKS